MNKLRLLVFVLWVSACGWAAAAHAADILPEGMTKHSIDVDGQVRWYALYKPNSFREGNPALLLLHGGTQSMYRVLSPNGGGMLRWRDIAEREGVLLVVPNASNTKGDADGNKQMWNDFRITPKNLKPKVDDVGFINNLLDEVIADHSVDASRIYVTGASNGGMMTYRLLAETPERFAAAATFISSLPVDNPEMRKPELPTPLLIMNGTDDPLVKWGGGQIAGRRGQVMSAEDNLTWWLEANKSDTSKAESVMLPDTDEDDDCTIQKVTYPALPGVGAETVFYIVQGGGHNLPSQAYKIPKLAKWLVLGNDCHDAEGAELAWDFMKTHSRRKSAED